MALEPPPYTDPSLSNVMKEWLNKFYRQLTADGSLIPWSQVSKTGSDLSDIQLRLHSDLQNLTSDDHTQYVLVSNLEADRATIATRWDDLTDGGASTLHKHDHGGQDGLGDDDHTQYLLANGNRNCTGQQEFEDNIVLPKTSGKGILVDTTTPTFGWRDLLGEVVPKTSGVGAPTLDTIQGRIRGFRYSTGDDGDGRFHITHDYVPASDVYGHLHWLWTNSNNAGTALNAGATISGAMKVTLYLSYAKGHNQANFSPEVAITVYYDTVNATTTPALRHRIDEVQISAAGGLISSAVNVSITSGTATLTSASALFSPADVNRTVRIVGAGTAGANLDTTISAYTSTTQVTLATNAATTITTQPNFRYRVLNTTDFEVDGIIQMHFDVDTIPTIVNAGGPTEPYIEYIDCHYQSTNMATKQKSPNFYT